MHSDPMRRVGCHRVRSLFINRSFKFCRDSGVAEAKGIYDDPSHEMHASFIAIRSFLPPALAAPLIPTCVHFHLVVLLFHITFTALAKVSRSPLSGVVTFRVRARLLVRKLIEENSLPPRLSICFSVSGKIQIIAR